MVPFRVLLLLIAVGAASGLVARAGRLGSAEDLHNAASVPRTGDDGPRVWYLFRNSSAARMSYSLIYGLSLTHCRALPHARQVLFSASSHGPSIVKRILATGAVNLPFLLNLADLCD